MSRRVVITGLGIVSCLGNDAKTVTDALRAGRSGIKIRQEQIDIGMRSHVAGAPEITVADHIDRKQLRFMGDAAAYAYISMPVSSPGPAVRLRPVRPKRQIFCGKKDCVALAPIVSPRPWAALCLPVSQRLSTSRV